MLRFAYPRGILAGTCWLPTLVFFSLTSIAGAPAANSGSLPAAAGPDSVVVTYLKSHARSTWSPGSSSQDSTILRRLGLDWPVRPWDMLSGQGVLVAGSPALRYFVLIGVGYGEFGPGGNCHYCLLDSLGNSLWTRDGRKMDLPQVSDAGDVVLFESDDRDGNHWPPDLIVRWLSYDGAVAGEHVFGPLVARIHQRSGSNEVQVLDGAARRVYFTINEQPEPGQPSSAGSLGENNNVRLVAMNPDGSVGWTYPLRGMAANSLDLALGGHRLIVDDLGEADADFANVLIVLTNEGHLVRRIVLEKNRRCYQPVVEANGRYLLFADGALRRMDVDTGDVQSVEEPDWLEEQALAWKMDVRARLASLRMDQLDRLRAEVTAEKDTDWPEFFRRWGHRQGR